MSWWNRKPRRESLVSLSVSLGVGTAAYIQRHVVLDEEHVTAKIDFGGHEDLAGIGACYLQHIQGWPVEIMSVTAKPAATRVALPAPLLCQLNPSYTQVCEPRATALVVTLRLVPRPGEADDYGVRYV